MVEVLNGLSATWLDYFLPAVVQNTVFLVIILVMLRLLSGRSARVKYLVAMAGLVKLVLPPFIPIPHMGGTQAVLNPAFGSLIPFFASPEPANLARAEATGTELTAAAVIFSLCAAAA